MAGTGHKAIVELEEQVRAHVEGRPKVASVYPHPIAFNALPHIDVFLDNGYTKEEWKVVTESRKILHLPELRVSCTAVRVPVFVSHSEAVHVETRDPITPDRARALFAGVKGVVVQDDPAANEYPLARTPPARTRCSSAASARTRRSTATAAWRSGSSRTTCARAPRPTPSRSPRRSSSAAGSRREPRRARASATRPVTPVGNRRGLGGAARVTRDERRAALEAIASEVRDCTRCRLHEGRTQAVPGEGTRTPRSCSWARGRASTRTARVGRSWAVRAACSSQLLGSIGWQREDVFITNVVKCRPPDNRDPQPDEIAACAPYLRRQLEALDPAVVVTLGRYSMATFMPGARIGQVHGTTAPIDPETRRRRDALAFAMYHPAAALRTPALERESYADIARVPGVLLRARERPRAGRRAGAAPRPPRPPATDAPRLPPRQPRRRAPWRRTRRSPIPRRTTRPS